MAKALRGALQLAWHKRRSPEVWLLLSNLLARALGFWVSLLVSRQAGVQALGLYSGVLITTASPTTPMSAVMANNATLMAARHHHDTPLWIILRAHRWPVVVSLLMAGLGCALLFRLSGLHQAESLTTDFVLLVGFGLILGQLLTQLVVGVCHGADLSLPASVLISALTVLAILSALPVLYWLGMPGILAQASLVALLPGVLLGLWLWRKQREAAPPGAMALEREAGSLALKALPSVAATVLNNATNWIACVYLAERVHGREGLGLVAIGLQWMAVMLLPMTSWSGRVMRALAVAHQGDPMAFWQEVRVQVRKCLLVSAAASTLVACGSVPIAALYKVDAVQLSGLFVINAVAASLAAVNFVYERVFYCLGQQRPWLWVSAAAYLGQVLLTYVLIPYSIWAVAGGNLFAVLVVLVLVSGYMKRLRAQQCLQGEALGQHVQKDGS